MSEDERFKVLQHSRRWSGGAGENFRHEFHKFTRIENAVREKYQLPAARLQTRHSCASIGHNHFKLKAGHAQLTSANHLTTNHF
jgi:hypothetical protein